MKKKLAVLLAMVMILCVVFTGCGSGDVAGTTWKLDDIEMEGQDSAAVKLVLSMMGEMTMSFKKDGTVVMNVGGEEQSATYKQDGKKVTVADGDDEQVLTISGNKMKMNSDEGTLIFKKK